MEHSKKELDHHRTSLTGTDTKNIRIFWEAVNFLEKKNQRWMWRRAGNHGELKLSSSLLFCFCVLTVFGKQKVVKGLITTCELHTPTSHAVVLANTVLGTQLSKWVLNKYS